MDRHKEVKTVDDNQLDTYWWINVIVGVQYAKNHQETFDTPAEFQEMWDGCLGCIGMAKRHIELTATDIHPIIYVSYHPGPRAPELKKDEIDKMICINKVEPLQLEWALQITSFPKMAGLLQLCIDYKMLIAVTIKEAYPILRMNDWLDLLGEERLFSTLNTRFVFWPINTDDWDNDETTWLFHHGLYRFQWMPFGLKNSKSTSQTHDAWCTVNIWGTDRTGIRAQCNHLLKIRPRSSGPPKNRTRTTASIWCIIKPEERLLLQTTHLLFTSRNAISLTWHIDQSN